MMTRHASGGPKKRATARRPRALITGGAVRVGRAVALALARGGMDVAIGYHRSDADAIRTIRELERAGARAVALRADLAAPAAAGRLVRGAARALGGLDVLVNSAGIFYPTTLGATTPAQFDRLLAVNLRGAFFCCQAAVEVLGDGGHIVNIGDAGTDRGWPSYVAYAASKAGIISLTRSLALALRPRRIAVNCVGPGTVLRPPDFSGARWRAISRDHEGSPEDVAAAVHFFATCPTYITGQFLKVDGAKP